MSEEWRPSELQALTLPLYMTCWLCQHTRHSFPLAKQTKKRLCRDYISLKPCINRRKTFEEELLCVSSVNKQQRLNPLSLCIGPDNNNNQGLNQKLIFACSDWHSSSRSQASQYQAGCFYIITFLWSNPLNSAVRGNSVPSKELIWSRLLYF